MLLGGSGREMSESTFPADRGVGLNGVFISWVGHHGRSDAIAKLLGIDAVFLPRRRGGLGVFTSYPRQFIQTVITIRRRKPSVVILMLPPLPALLALLVSLRSTKSVVADLHTGFFHDPKWRWAKPVSLRLLKSAGLLVTNEALARLCSPNDRGAVVLHDILTLPQTAELTVCVSRKPSLLFPLSYANDEPVDELMEAARRLPEIEFVFTGSAPGTVRESAPENVRFTGFIDEISYWREVSAAWGMGALTTRGDTMQRAGYEALLCNKPILTSDHEVLEEFFESAAVYVAPDAKAIADGITQLISDRARLMQEGTRILKIRRAEQAVALESTRRLIREILSQSIRNHQTVDEAGEA